MPIMPVAKFSKKYAKDFYQLNKLSIKQFNIRNKKFPIPTFLLKITEWKKKEILIIAYYVLSLDAECLCC